MLPHTRRPTLLLLAAVALAAAAPASPAAAPPLSLDPGRVAWSHLTYAAKGFLASVRVTLQLTALPTLEARREWIDAPEGAPLASPPGQTWQLDAEVGVDPLFRSPVRLFTRVWFDPRNGAALARTRLREREDPFEKRYRFTATGVHRRSREPDSATEAAGGPDGWTRLGENFYPYGDAPGCSQVTVAPLFPYLAAAAPPGDALDGMALCVFGKRALHRVRLRAEPGSPVPFDYELRSGDETVRAQGVTPTRRLTLRPEAPPDGADPEENLSFLGLHGEIALDLEPASGVPVQISGDLPGVGRVALRLREWQRPVPAAGHATPRTQD